MCSEQCTEKQERNVKSSGFLILNKHAALTDKIQMPHPDLRSQACCIGTQGTWLRMRLCSGGWLVSCGLGRRLHPVLNELRHQRVDADGLC